MTDRDFDVHAYDQGYRDGKADAAREIDRLARDYNTARDAHDALLLENERLLAALEEARADLSTSLKIDAQKDAAYDKLRAALKEITEDNWFFIEDAKGIARAALEGK